MGARDREQLLELERALTDRWEAALYLEGDKIDGEDYLFSGWRFESRYRLFEYGAFLNPVLYVEYENLRPDHKYLLDVTGRTCAGFAKEARPACKCFLPETYSRWLH